MGSEFIIQDSSQWFGVQGSRCKVDLSGYNNKNKTETHTVLNMSFFYVF